MRLFKQLVEEIQDWGDEAHGTAVGRQDGLSRHLILEAGEVAEAAAYADQDAVAMELADVFILSCGIARAMKVDLESAIEKKMAINRARKWAKPDAQGVIRHVE